MKKIFTTLLLVFALVGFVGLTGSMAVAATSATPVYCNPAYTAWAGAPGSENATCPVNALSQRDPAPTFCSSAYANWIGAPGSQGATCPALIAIHHRNNARN